MYAFNDHPSTGSWDRRVPRGHAARARLVNVHFLREGQRNGALVTAPCALASDGSSPPPVVEWTDREPHAGGGQRVQCPGEDVVLSESLTRDAWAARGAGAAAGGPRR